MNLRQMLLSALARLRGDLDEVFPAWASPLADESGSRTDLHQQVAPELRRFTDAVQAALDALQTGTTAAATAHGQAQYVPAERSRRAAEALTEARTGFDRSHAAAGAALDEVTRLVRAAGLPPRPAPADAAQEAALANVRADMRMILDAVPAGQLAERIVELTGEAAANRDALTTWLLAGSPWAGRYLASRGQDGMTEWLASNIGRALAPTGSRQVQQAVRALPLLEDGQHAARRLVDVFLPAVAQEELDDAAAMRSVA
jgi:hypothetical protein